MRLLKLPTIWLAVCAMLLTFPCNAQTESEVANDAPRWNFSSATFQLSAHDQFFSEMDHKRLLNVSAVPFHISENMEEYQKTNYFDASFYSNKAGVSFGLIKNSDTKWKREVVLGARFMFGSEVMLDYEKNSNASENISFCLVENAFELEVSHLFRKDNENTSLFFGPSLSFGQSFGNELIIFRSNYNAYSEDYYKATNSFLMVGHLNAGAFVNIYDGIGMRMAVQAGCGYS
ncbi:MAG: hypothetical protein HKO56_04175, partial [Bacteroidia bacterium]|nr:hypothetical protein [Bacteroidia bacterium]